MSHHHTSRLGYVLSSGWATFIIAFMLASPIIWWSTDRQEPVKITGLSLWPEEARPGDKISRVITVTRRRSCETEVDVIIIDGARVRWVIDEPVVTSPGPVGVSETYKVPVIIPPLASPGLAEMRIVAKRRCNPLHNLWPIITQYEPIRFTILPAGAAP